MLELLDKLTLAQLDRIAWDGGVICTTKNDPEVAISKLPTLRAYKVRAIVTKPGMWLVILVANNKYARAQLFKGRCLELEAMAMNRDDAEKMAIALIGCRFNRNRRFLKHCVRIANKSKIAFNPLVDDQQKELKRVMRRYDNRA